MNKLVGGYIIQEINMRAVFFETTKEDEKVMRKLLNGTGIEAEFFGGKLTSDNIKDAGNADIFSVFIDSEIGRDIIDAVPNLKLIATRSTGFDHIDLEYAHGKNIVVSNVPAYGERTVAEFTFALMLVLSRKIFNAYHQLREEGKFDILGLQGFDLYKKTLGVVGSGKIGKNVIRIAKGFAMDVLAYDIFPDEEFAKKLEFKYVDLPNLLSNSDIVTIHVPYNEKTYHLIDKEGISRMKKGAYLINTARGEVVDTEALLEALISKHLAGAGLDVLEGERALKEEMELVAGKERIHDLKTLLQNHAFIDLPQAIVTPHIAFYSEEAKKKILKTTSENIISFMGGKPQNIV